MERNEYLVKKLEDIIAIDSPSGFTSRAADYIINEIRALGFKAEKTVQGGVLCDFGGEDNDKGVIMTAHFDTLGSMVRQVKGNGRLQLTHVGGVNLAAYDTSIARVYTRDGRCYEGTLQFVNASSHVNPDSNYASRNWGNMELVLDEDVHSAEDTKKLGITVGCYVCYDPYFKITDNGYIKSKYLDDKLSIAIILAYAKHLADNKIKPKRHVYAILAAFEEVGHGVSGILPKGVVEYLGVDMGCVGDGLDGDERKVSICAQDAASPYNYEINCELIRLCEENNIDYAVDYFEHYDSDCSAAARHMNIKEALIGPGVYASHGYERSHLDGAENTLKLLKAYLA